MRILIDIDDTIENLCEAWCDYLMNKYGTTTKYEDIESWDMTEYFSSISEDELYSAFHDDNFWDTLKPKPMAPEYVKKLIDDGNQVFLCTATDYRNIKVKFEKVVKKYFPYIEWKDVIVTYRKDIIDADWIIDDGEHNLIGGRHKKILFSAPHNRYFDTKSNGIFRADNWKEVYEIISNNS